MKTLVGLLTALCLLCVICLFLVTLNQTRIAGNMKKTTELALYYQTKYYKCLNK